MFKYELNERVPSSVFLSKPFKKIIGEIEVEDVNVSLKFNNARE